MAKSKVKAKSKTKLKAVPTKKPAPKASAAAKGKSKGKAQKAARSSVPKSPAKKASAPKGATVHSLADAYKRKQSSHRDWTKIISPLDDRVLVQVENTEERMTPGGLYIPDTAQVTGNRQASVVAVGRGHRDKKGRVRPLELKVGDRVLIGEYAGAIVEIDGEKLQIVRESEVLGTVTK